MANFLFLYEYISTDPVTDMNTAADKNGAKYEIHTDQSTIAKPQSPRGETLTTLALSSRIRCIEDLQRADTEYGREITNATNKSRR